MTIVMRRSGEEVSKNFLAAFAILGFRVCRYNCSGAPSYDCVMSEILSITEAKDLLQLCKGGKLFDIQKWIASGKSIAVPDALRTTPLKVAVGTGFQSRVELLASQKA